MILVAAAVGISSPARAAEPESFGPRVVAGSGSWRAGIFTAAATGAVLELATHARVRVYPNAAVRVSPGVKGMELGPGPRTKTSSFALLNGRADVEMPAERSAVLASVGKLFAVVTAGRVALLAGIDEGTVANVGGDVRTILADHWQTVQLGSVATLSHENPSASAKPGLAFPALEAGPRMFFAPSTVALHGFHWPQVRGAARYELRLRRLADGKIVDQRSLTQPAVSEPLTAVDPGQDSLSLRSVDARGLESNWSPETELRVVGVLLPPGGYGNDQAVYIGEHQQVRFTHANGLEMTYVGADGFFPATHGVGLHRNQGLVVGFRLPGTTETATLHIEPRGVYAEVRIGPTRAVWPRDRVSIDIQLKSKSGEVPPFLQVVPKVVLGLEPLEVTFERTGNLLHAVVPTSTKPGPWVLRVDVADQFGEPLGRDFLEVATEATLAAPGRPKVAQSD